MAESGREPPAPPRPQAKPENVPIVSVEALLKLADWLEGWTRRNPDAWEQIQKQRTEAQEEAKGVATGDPPLPRNAPPPEGEVKADQPSARAGGRSATRRRTGEGGRGRPG